MRDGLPEMLTARFDVAFEKAAIVIRSGQKSKVAVWSPVKALAFTREIPVTFIQTNTFKVGRVKESWVAGWMV